MQRLHRGWVLLLAGMALPYAPARSEEATLRDGRRLQGKLTLDGKRWQFHPPGKAAPLAASVLHQVRLNPASLPPLRAGMVHRIHLRDGQALTAQLLGLDARTLTLRTAWADKLTLPRSAVASITQLPGWALVFVEDFEDDLRGWKVEGKVGVGNTATSGHKSLVLGVHGQVVEYRLPSPVEEGRAGVNFHDSMDTAGGTWTIEAIFRTPRGERTLAVTVAGEGPHYETQAGVFAGTAVRLPRSRGWHRLTVQFSRGSLRVVLDETVLWYNLKQGPGGSLVRWRLACRRTDVKELRGQVAFDEFALHRAVDEQRRPPGDPTQDEVLRSDNDQLFGSVLSADSRAVILKGSFGERTLPWTSVRSISLRAERGLPPEQDRERVRLWIENGQALADELEGVVLSLDERRCRLRHAHFGEIVLERGRLSRIRWPARE